MLFRSLRKRRVGLAAAVSLALASGLAHAEDPQTLEPIEVTTSKIPIALSQVAANVNVVSGDELRARGATDLRTALSLVAGVDIAPGGDGGPASSVPRTGTATRRIL